MRIPDQFVVEDGAFATDGGSIYLHLSGLAGSTHKLVLWQHLFIDDPDPDRLPGRLYFDDALVPVRSEPESQLLLTLRQARLNSPQAKTADAEDSSRSSARLVVGRDIQDYQSKIDEGPATALAHLVSELLKYVVSDAYVELVRASETPAGSR
jgi:hypothetical protein